MGNKRNVGLYSLCMRWQDHRENVDQKTASRKVVQFPPTSSSSWSTPPKQSESESELGSTGDTHTKRRPGSSSLSWSSFSPSSFSECRCSERPSRQLGWVASPRLCHSLVSDDVTTSLFSAEKQTKRLDLLASPPQSNRIQGRDCEATLGGEKLILLAITRA